MIQQLNLPNPSVPVSDVQLRKRASADIGGTTSIFMGVRSHSGQFVSQQSALRASAVLACVRILSEDLSACPLNLYRRTPTGAELAIDHPLFRLLHDIPNEWQTSFDLREGMMLDMLLYGRCFVEKSVGSDGITALTPLQAARMQYLHPQPDILPPDAPITWLYADPRGSRILFDDDLWRNNILTDVGTAEGRSICLLAREAIGLLLAAEEQGARLFSNGVQTGIVLKTTQTLDDEARKQLKESWNGAYAGSHNAFKTVLLENGIDATKIGLTAQESQYLEARQFQTADIARIFRVPDVMLGIASGKTSTFASAEQFFSSYVRFTLQPWMRRFEQTITRDLLATAEQGVLYARHDIDSIVRADLATRYAAHAVGIASGFLTRNEARRMEDLPELPGLDEPTLPLNVGTPNLKPGASAAKLAGQLAMNCLAHEAKLLEDGKPAHEVYTKMLPGYLRDKAGLPLGKCTEYCAARLAGAPDDLLLQLLIAG